MKADGFHLRELGACKRVELDEILHQAKIEKATHRSLEIALRRWCLVVHDVLQCLRVHRANAPVAVLLAKYFKDGATILLCRLGERVHERGMLIVGNQCGTDAADDGTGGSDT